MFFFCKHKTSYHVRISDWSSDVCSSDLLAAGHGDGAMVEIHPEDEVERVLQHIAGAHVVGQSRVAETGVLFRARHALVDRDAVVIGDMANEMQDVAQRLARSVAGQDDIGDRKSTRLNSSH